MCFVRTESTYVRILFAFNQPLCPRVLLSHTASQRLISVRPGTYAYKTLLVLVLRNLLWNTEINIPRVYETDLGNQGFYETGLDIQRFNDL